ncbi:hypothetical protein PpBr36_05507 [Pyricularia pennisetigena]|uniref:hypothetical protein n=1 Tax=Pyricularia pennisetigena TaxID=1578925 RepID=UPI001153E1EF|nr:hypothetical protein PpBr36_05507 [Pyricularia pennisetigena]TLS27236.1 hypothetical protein PpBr36_05507 [Pyricularia pennisetigena]
MPSGFPFAYVCNLLQRCEDNAKQCGPKTNHQFIKEWLASHKRRITADHVDLSALISTLLPTKRPDRVYSIQIKRLTSIVARAHHLGRTRVLQLEAWQQPGSGKDFAECVRDVLSDTPNTCTAPLITVEEVDEILHCIAARSRFSSPKVQSYLPTSGRTDECHVRLQQLYNRLEPNQAKWLTRLVLKDWSPVDLNPTHILKGLDPLLPVLLKIYDDVPTAVSRLTQQRGARGVTTYDDSTGTAIASLAARFKPTLGVKVARQDWIKGRSIKHCMQMGRGRMSVEKKMDGEYCQVHIDLSKGPNCIQIFSKSGKDSTIDRVNLHPAIRASLQIGGTKPCRIKTGCILEGELVVYSEKEGTILPFEKIRKHVSRAGTYFHRSDDDSQAHPWERLMIVYYDVLMIDDESLLGVRHSDRFKRLEQLISCSPGVAAIVQRQVIDFDQSSHAASDLRRVFAQCITSHEEGLVLKADDPYFDFGDMRKMYYCCAIKLKKEYVGNFGDVGDFAIVGARYDPVKAKDYDMPNLRWTHFYVGCLTNKDKVQQMEEHPRFVVVNVVELNKTQMEYFAKYVSPDYASIEDAPDSAPLLHFERGIDNGKRPSIAFPQPPVFDLRCFSFTRDANVGKHYTMRFPMVSKIHCDRTWREAVTLDELQKMAKRELDSAQPDDSQELQEWIARLENADPGRAIGISQESGMTRQTTSQESLGSDLCALDALAARVSPRPVPTGDSSKQTPGRAATACKLGTPPVIDLTMSPPKKAVLKRRSTVPDTRSSKTRRLEQIDLNLCSDTAATSHRAAEDVISCSEDANVEADPKVHAGDSVILSSFSADGDAGLPSAPGQDGQGTSKAGKCKYHGKDCAFKGWVFLLSPCVAGFPWVTDDLLGGHGVHKFETDVAAWNGFLEAEDMAIAAARDRQERPRLTKKMIIVDGRRREATQDFLMKIEMRREERRERYGRAGLAEVFDWRVLEVVMDRERLTASGKGERRGSRLDKERCEYEFRDKIWRKHYVGLV